MEHYTFKGNVGFKVFDKDPCTNEVQAGWLAGCLAIWLLVHTVLC